MAITAKHHTVIVQAALANSAVLKKSLPTFRRMGSPMPMFKVLKRLPGISPSAKRAIAQMMQALQKEKIQFTMQTPNQRRYAAFIYNLMSKERSIARRIALLQAQLKKAPPKSRSAIGLKVAIDILRDGKDTIYNPRPPRGGAIAESGDDALAAEDVGGAIIGGFTGGLLGAIAHAVAASVLGGLLTEDPNRGRDDDDDDLTLPPIDPPGEPEEPGIT
jgi:hypothetical protein